MKDFDKTDQQTETKLTSRPEGRSWRNAICRLSQPPKIALGVNMCGRGGVPVGAAGRVGKLRKLWFWKGGEGKF